MENKDGTEFEGRPGDSASYDAGLDLMREKLMRVEKKDLVEAILKMTNLLHTLEKEKKVLQIPVSLFKYTELSAYELIVSYLKDNLNLTLTEIGRLTGRNPQAVYITLRNAKAKYEKELLFEYTEFDVPLSTITDRDYSILENIVAYLVEKKGLTLAEISKILYRDNRTIWTIYDRFKKKRDKL